MSRDRNATSRVGALGALLIGTFVSFIAPTAWAHQSCPLNAWITSPPAGQAVFGPTEVVIELSNVADGTRVDSVALELDGSAVAKLPGHDITRPYRVRVDVGEENREHRFAAVVHTADGAQCNTAIRTPALQIDSEYTVELMQLYVTVTDGGRRVLDLEEEDFRVEDEGRPQEIVTFEGGDVPLTAVLLVDSSASMAGARLETALAGARAFIEGMEELDRSAVLLFSDCTRRLTPFAADVSEIAAPLEGVQASGNTAVNDSLFLALERLDARQGRRVAILLSDGADVHSALDMSQVLWKVQRSQAIVYWIRLADEQEPATFFSSWRNGEGNDAQLRHLERAIVESGGRITTVSSLEEVTPAFREILSELRDQYVIGYYPSSVRSDGSWHEVDVRVKRRGVRVRARRGYIDF